MSNIIPYHIVLFPRVDSSQAAQVDSFRLATELSRIGESKTHIFEVFDFELNYARFLAEGTFLPEEKNEPFFIEQYKNVIFKPGVITFVANLDKNDICLLVNSCLAYSQSSKVLVIVTSNQFDEWGLLERSQCVDCCFHEGYSSKGMMEKLGMIPKEGEC